jgi:circadian clock protein KaiB
MTIRLLYVEDDDALRQLFSMMLVNEGYDVVPVSNAEDAILELQTGSYDVLLTDYRLPNKNADWMLQVAKGNGSLRSTAVVILTADREPPGVEGYRVLHKPVDIAVLFACLDEAVAARALFPAGVEAAVTTPHSSAMQLRLYVTSTSRESKKAVRNLHRLLDKWGRPDIRLEVLDVGDARLPAEALEEDRVIVTPTLVRTLPLPKVWVFGDLSRSELVEDLIVPGRQ